MIPGMGAMLAQGGGDDQDATMRVKKVIYITDSMNAAELDSDGSIFLDTPAPSASTSKAGAVAEGSSSSTNTDKMPVGMPRKPNKHLLRVARGSGTSVSEVEEVLAQHRMLTGMVKQFGGLAGMAKAQQQGGGAGGIPGMGRGRGGAGPGGMAMPSQAQIQQMQRSLPPQFQGPGGMAQLQQMARVRSSPTHKQKFCGSLFAFTVYGHHAWSNVSFRISYLHARFVAQSADLL